MYVLDLVMDREVVDWVAGVVILDKGTGRHTIPDARKPGAIGNYQIRSDEEGVLITVSIKGHDHDDGILRE